MNKIYIVISVVLMLWFSASDVYSQTVTEQQQIQKTASLIESAVNDFQEERYSLCEAKINEAIALYTKLTTDNPALAQPTFLYAPCVLLARIYEQQNNIDQSIEYYEYAFQIGNQNTQALLDSGLDLDSYLGVWISLRDMYDKKKNYEKALVVSKGVVEVSRVYLPEILSQQLNNLGISYQNVGDNEGARKCFQEAMEIVSASGINDSNAEAAFTALQNLVAHHMKLSKYQNALDEVDKYKPLVNTVASKYPDELYLLNILISRCCIELDLFERAFKATQNTAAYALDRYGEYSLDHVNRVNDLAYIYTSFYEARSDLSGALTNARETFEYGLKIWNKIPHNEAHTNYATFLNNYGLFLLIQNDYFKASETFNNALLIHKKQGAGAGEIISTTINLASSEFELHRYDRANELYLEALSLCDENNYSHSEQCAKIYRFLALLQLTAYHNEQKADEFANHAYSILTELDNENLEYVRLLQLLGRIYSEIGDYSKSFDMLYQAIQIKFALNLTVTPYEWISLAEACRYNDEAAITACKNALADLQNGEDDGQKARALDIMGYAYLGLGQYEEAEPRLLKAMQIRKRLFGEHSEPYEASLSSLVVLQNLQGNYAEAEKYALQTLSINDDMKNRGNIVATYYMSNNPKGIEEHLPAFYDKSIEVIKKRFLFLDEQQRATFIDSDEISLEAMSSIAFRFPNSSLCMQYAYNTALTSKGLLLNTSKEIKAIIESIEDNAIRKDYAEFQKLQYELTKVSDSLQYANISQKISQKEKLLQRIISRHDDFTKSLDLQWDDIKERLSDNMVAVEFINCYQDYVGNDNTEYYAALILRKGWDAPQMIPLFEREQLAKLDLSKAINSIAGYDKEGQKVAQLVWGPLMKYVNEGDNVYFSPSGALHQIAIESLPADNGRLMNEKYNMYRLSSTKQLCYDHPTPKYDKVVLYGGLTYDLDEEVMASESRAYSQSRDVHAKRGFEADSVYRAGWGILAGTKTEVKNISKTLGNNSVKYVLFEGQAGNEESFRALSGQKNQIIHIATHGFFLPLHEARKKDYFRPIDGNTPVVDNLMRRSGLMMAGGNRAWRGEPIPDDIEDGVLTSQEIVSLDLRGTDLVMLSACETGLGEVTGEGVFGLQRAFKKAGAQTLVMSLWRVSDAATELMMSEFYSNLIAGKSKRESFLTAQSAVRVKYPQPYYWAAFIMLD